MAGAAVAALAGAGWYGFDYWTVGRYLVSTDDAYVKADNTTVAPKVSGYLHEVLVGDNERVRAGQVLARIDERDFNVALDQAKADVAAAHAAIASKHAQLGVQQAVIDAAKATVDVDKATVTFAAQENKRYTDLAATGFGSVQNAQQAQSRNAGAQAAIARDTANLASALKQVDLLKAEIVQANAALARAQAQQSQAELNLEYTSIVAPIDGVVGNRSLRIGQFVQAGTQLMSVVPVAGAYVLANFKETQLTDVRAGQAVEIAVDTFPGQIVRGHVDSIAPASGQEFALLPPDNATGNFTKVVQRIPVKIALDLDEGSVVELRPGMSVIPTVETKSQARIRRAAAALRAPARVSGG
jgi:membrane fusion protein (multidrug efflux system)